MRRRVLAPVAMAMTVAAAAPAGAAMAAAPVGDHVAVKDVASGSTVVTHRGDRLLVKLTACESCGYQWRITDKPDAQVEPFVHRRPSVSQCASPCAGGNAVERFVFSSAHAGRTGVTFGYFGPGRKHPSETRHLRLVVHHRSAA